MPRSLLRLTAAALMSGAIVLARPGVQACTAFCAASGGQVLVGNNEDWNNPRTKIWFVPATPGTYGRMYVGFDDMWPQGGMNEHGLWFDGFAAPAMKATASAALPSYPGNIIDAAMAECSTVAEVVQLFGRYNRSFLSEAILMFADASGDAVSIEANAMVRKKGRHFVQANFHQSLSPDGNGDGRFATATGMLERAGDGISTDLFRRILAATHQNGGSPTLYSNIYDLRAATMHLYYFHDFEHAVTFKLADELKKGARVLDIPALFPRNADAEAFAARRPDAAARPVSLPARALMVAIPAVVFVLIVYGIARGGRRVRVGLAAVGLAIAAAAALTIVTLTMSREASPRWVRFSIGPSSGESVWINTSRIQGDGVSLKTAIATAYDMPPVRVIGPEWLGRTRYAINAVVGVEEEASFRSLLQEELKERLRLATHVEMRPFDVLVLTAAGTPRLQTAAGRSTGIWIDKREARLRETPMPGLASTLQSVIGRPVIDETGITGTYNFDLRWEDDKLAALTALVRDRYGLELTPVTREMEALIVDSVRRDVELVLLDHAGRLTRAVPPDLRRRLSGLLTVH